MAVSFGIVGLPNVGKSTLFNLLTGSSVKVSNYPFCTTDHHDGMVTVPDERLLKLAELLSPAECIQASIMGVDIAGLVQGASRGEGLGNQFLGHVREVDVILHVLRAFSAGEIAHVTGDVAPLDDFRTVNTELILSDIETVDRRLDKLKGKAQSGDRESVEQARKLQAAKEKLESGSLLTGEALTEGTLSTKPQVLVFNCDDYDTRTPEVEGFTSIAIPVTMEAELAEMTPEEQKQFLADMGRDQLTLNGLIRTVFNALGLITFYTTANDILQAWPIPGGTTVSRAAGGIHTDMQQKFVRASVVTTEDILECKSVSEARSRGLVRTEGRDYEVQDGDIVEIAF